MANPLAGAVDYEPKSTRFHTVFVDTSLDTHMVMTVDEFDTVADFKKKILREHALCFPKVGEIGINTLQVRRRGFMYNLSESMYVRCAFDGVKCRWFVYVDVCRLFKQSLKNGQGNGMLCLENCVMEDRMDERVNEADKCVQNIQKGDCLNDGDAVNDTVMKVLEHLEVDYEHTGGDHFKTSSSDTNKRVETEVDRANIPNRVKKRKIEVVENPNDKYFLNDDVSTRKKVCKREKKERCSAKRSGSKTSKSTVVATEVVENSNDKYFLNDDVSTRKKVCKREKKEKDSAKRSGSKTSKSTVVATAEAAENGDTIELLNVTNSCVNNTVVSMLCDSDLDSRKALQSAPSTDGRVESVIELLNEDLVKDQSHVSRQPIGATNVLSNDEDALRTVPANEDSSMAKTTVDGKQLNGPDPAAASMSEVPTEKSKPSTKRKKKKTKSKSLPAQVPSEVPVPPGNSDIRIGLQFTNTVDEVNMKIPGTQNIEDAVCEKKTHIDQSILMDKNTVLPERQETMSSGNQKPSYPRENNLVLLEAPEVLHSDANQATLKSEKTSKKKKKQKNGSSKKKKTKSVTEGVEATQCEILCDQSAENVKPKSEITDASQLGVDKTTDEVADGFTDGRSVVDNELGTDRSDMQSLKAAEVNPNALRPKDISDISNPVHVNKKSKKLSKRKRSSATNPSEIQVQEKVVNPSPPTDDINCEDKSVAQDKGMTENIGMNDCKIATSIGTCVETAHAIQVEGKHLDSAVATNPSVDENTKDNKLSSGTEEINFSDYFVPSQQKPELVVPFEDAVNVNNERIAVKDTTEDSKVKDKTGTVEDGKKSQVGSSQESSSMRLPHGAVLHSDTESFRVPKDRKPSTSISGKQKSKSKDKKSIQVTSEVATLQSPSASKTQKSKSSDEKLKQITSEGAALLSPSVSETQKSNPSHDATKLNKIQSKENAEAFTASNSTLKSPVPAQRTKPKPKQPASKKSSSAKLNQAQKSTNRRKTLLSANIFNDDKDESSEDEEAVTSVHSAGTFLEDTNASDVSEMEDDTGFATPITGQRKAAEVDNDSIQNKYTLEKLRESARLEKARRAEELGIPLEEYVPDSQAELIE